MIIYLKIHCNTGDALRCATEHSKDNKKLNKK